MPRPVTAEDSLITKKHEGLQRSKTFETGLVLAHIGGKSDALLHFAPTPEEEGGFTFKKGAVDAEWMVQHAELVARMLPAGIAVVGCYAFAANAKLSKMESSLQPVLNFLAKRINGIGPESRQAVLLMLPSDAKKVSCRVLDAGSSRPSPVELKLVHAPPQVRSRAQSMIAR